ncbi:hypothetical protein [Sandaracinus amylolyticus]|uniref:hypothetical protein n=1 Tax=Sandaracinus amylolyticus TaxID=927083 RepID=UPI001F2D5463|nr:hypothetical protein [Sandaracinus amylolyticus]UJR86705.1 Hypothetical protein I5071_88060 [Sandaracinus amylolyticus]
MTLTEYDKAYASFIQQAILGFAEQDPLLSKIRAVTSRHRGPHRLYHEQKPIDLQTVEMESGSTLAFDAIRRSDIEAVSAFVHELASGYVEQMSKQFFASADKVVGVTGLEFDARGKPLSWDLVNDMLERMDIDFDENGAPKLPSLVVNPQVAREFENQAMTQEQSARHAQIIQAKKEQYDAAKRSRRISV